MPYPRSLRTAALIGALVILAGAALALFVVQRASSQAAVANASQTYGRGVAVNIAAVSMQPRATDGCPYPPSESFCVTEPGFDGGPVHGGPEGSEPNMGYLTKAQGTFYAPLVLPAGARIIRLELIGQDTDTSEGGPTASLWSAGVGQQPRRIAAIPLSGSATEVRTADSTDMTPGARDVRADRAYYVSLYVPPTTTGQFALQMVRVIYRPRA